MIVLGIDPGSRRIGYGFVQRIGGKTEFLEAGLLNIRSSGDKDALRETKMELDALIKKHKPDVLGIEKLFFMKNRKTAMSVAQARGVIMLCAAESDIEVREYSPNEVKSAITGYGNADKKAVSKMVRLLLAGVSENVLDDVTDALAIALIASASAQRVVPNSA